MLAKKPEDQQTKSTKFKAIASGLWDIAKALILIEIALAITLVAYFGVNYANGLLEKTSPNSSAITTDSECVIQTIEGKVYKICQE